MEPGGTTGGCSSSHSVSCSILHLSVKRLAPLFLFLHAYRITFTQAVLAASRFLARWPVRVASSPGSRSRPPAERQAVALADRAPQAVLPDPSRRRV